MTETQTQQECPYCHGDEPKYLIDAYNMVCSIDIKNKKLVADEVWDYSGYEYESIPQLTETRISYCPVCGRKLEGEE